MTPFNSKQAFGSVIRVRRNQLGISQEALAERANLHRTYVCDVERGARNVSLEVIERLAAALEVSTASLFSSQDSSKPSDELVEILFVEDDANDAEMTYRALGQIGLANRTHLLTDGAAAINFLFGTGTSPDRALPKPPPQLVLLDLNLPKVGGLEVLRRIKADARTAHIPVIVLSASKRDRDIAMSQRLGAEGYIVKPVTIASLSTVTPQLQFRWALCRPPLHSPVALNE